MKKNSSLLFLLWIAPIGVVCAQSNVSPSMNFRIEREVVPPYLEMVPNSVKFTDDNGNNVINASEACAISFDIQNTGKGEGYGCVARLNAEGTTQGLTYKNQTLPTIKVGEKRTITFPITASQYTADGKVNFTIQVTEPNGFGTEACNLSVSTRRFLSPMVEVVSYKISSEGNAQLRKKKSFKLQLLLQNTDLGVANDVELQLQVPENMFLQDGERYYSFATLKPNEKRTIELEFLSNDKVPDEMALEFQVTEKHGKYAKNATIPLQFGQAISSGTTNLAIAAQTEEEVRITRGSLLSDVDENIPQSDKKSTNTFVLIVANENYQEVVPVRFALNDGTTFRTYCKQTLGIADNQIHYVANATGNQMKTEINWIQKVAKTFDHVQVIVYYAGHGIPDESDRTAYLLPVDGNAQDMSTCYRLDDLYSTLGNMGAERVTIFMDACFSGSKREKGMIAEARGVAIKAKSGVPQGNMVVFSAAQGDETAYPYEAQQHGMFTYYLLKYLQQTKGTASLGEMGEYITKSVSQQSLLENDRTQTPCVTPSTRAASDWRKWTLR